MRIAKQYHSFEMRAYIFMSTHFHILIRLGDGVDIGKLMQSIQHNDTRNFKRKHRITETLHLWHRSYWDHIVRDEMDYEQRMGYIHYNPVKHGLVSEPAEYEQTSIHEVIRRGWYGPAWINTVDPSEWDAYNDEWES